MTRAFCNRPVDSQLLYIQHFCQLVEDFGVIVVAVEHFSIHTFCQNGHRQAGVAVGGEGDAGLVVQDVGQRDGQGIVSTVHHIFRLCVNTRLGAVDALFKGHTQLIQLISRQNQLVALFAFRLQAEQLLDVSQSFLKGGAAFLVSSGILVIELLEGDLLALQQGQVGVVVRTGKADGQAAGSLPKATLTALPTCPRRESLWQFPHRRAASSRMM